MQNFLKIGKIFGTSLKNYNFDKYLFYRGWFLSILFILLSVWVYLGMLNTFDQNMTIWLQKILPRELDVPFSLITYLGSSEIITVVVALIFMSYLYIKQKALLGFFSYPVIFIVEIIGKSLISHPDPPLYLNRVALNFRMPSSHVVHTGFSYPSGHMARTSFLTTVLIIIFLKSKASKTKKKLVVLLSFVFISVIFISRIYLGEHWLSDVLGGLFLGLSSAFFGSSFLVNYESKR